MAVAVTDYHVLMKTWRITMDVDERVANAIQGLQSHGLSEVAVDTLRKVLEYELHRSDGLRWIEELNEEYGYPTAEDYAWADAVLDEAMGLSNGKADPA